MKYELDISPDERERALAALSPTGFRVLVALGKTTDMIGNIYIPETRKSDEDVASILATVIAVGPDAYQDRDRFPAGPYCKVGDVIMMASYSGRRLKINEREYRLINDDSVIAVVAKPEEISRA